MKLLNCFTRWSYCIGIIFRWSHLDWHEVYPQSGLWITVCIDFIKYRLVFISLQIDGLQALVDQQALELNNHKVWTVVRFCVTCMWCVLLCCQVLCQLCVIVFLFCFGRFCSALLCFVVLLNCAGFFFMLCRTLCFAVSGSFCYVLFCCTVACCVLLCCIDFLLMICCVLLCQVVFCCVVCAFLGNSLSQGPYCWRGHPG